MRQLTKRRVAAFIGGALYGLTAASPVLADDTEIYVGLANTATGSKPNVLFVIDTSGSMDTDVTITTSTAAYNPAVTYTGSTCVSTRLYWSATGSIPDCSTSQYFTASQYRCDTGSTAMGTTGFYQDRHARWSTFGTDRWRTFSSAWGKNPPHVDCKADNGTHGENSTDPKVYIKNQSGSNKDPWTATPSSGINWDSTGGFYTVYNHNYMNWANESTSTSTTTRLQIVKDVVNGIINANSGLKVGLMRFDTKSHGSSSRNKGGPVIHAITDIDTAGVKTALVNAVNGLTASSYTPLAETLYEALLYYRGQAVKFGKAPNNIVSVTPSLNPSDPNKYASPITNQCQKNFVVYLTDDAPTRDKDADTDITTLLSGASGLTLGSCGFNNSPSDDCLDEVAEYMKEQDHATTALGNEQAGTQNIITYTVGFATSQTLLSSAATLGGGKYYTANNSTELASAFTQIVAEIQAVNSTFTAPAVSVNAFNRIQHRKELYFTLFKPAAQPHWDGNVKRFELDFVLDASGNPLDDDGDGIPNPPEILDVNGDAAVDANTGFFKSTATSYWTPTADAPDGEQTEKGGAASKLPDPPSTRKVYTNISTTIFDLANAANKLHEDTTAITETVLGLSAGATDPSRAELLRWSRGVDINDDDEDSSTTDGRLVLGAPLHARPLLVTYGGTETNPDLTLYALTNDGYLHAIDPDDGTEVFSFVPKEHLDNLKTLYDDTGAVTTINYGVDGNFEVWVEDHNDNGIIETPDSGSNYDHVYVYFGMRRGRTTYYALDVTDRTALKVLWSITGGEGGTVTGTTGFDELADTWSDPQHHTIKVLSGGALVSKDVIVFGGGYDAGQDNATNPTTDDEGRAIYIVDATTGALLWWAGKTGVAPTPGPDLALSAMDYSIPSQVRVLDINTDGIADRMYVGDMGGQVWRFDIDNDTVASLASRITGGVVATLQKATATSTPTSTENRRFFVPPDVALVDIPGGSDFLSLAMGSGYRAHPLNTTIQDRFYTLFDYDIYEPPKDGGGNITYTAIQEDDLIDRTAIGATGSQTGGWYIQLKNLSTSVYEGEKVLASALTFGGKILFTTFTPVASASSSSCAPSQGVAKLYQVDVVDADPIENLDETGGSTLTVADRSLTLVRSGIPPEVTILFPGLSAPADPVTLVGAEKVDLDLGQTPVRTYWFQEQK